MDPTMQKMLEEMMSSVNLPPEVHRAVAAALADPSKLDAALEQLKAMGADQMGSGPPLSIADYYKPAPGLYQLRWPLGLPMELPVPFDRLDRQTQFFVLFQEWTRRELEGMMLLNSGDLDGAERVFEECVERATQIDVAELQARSYEGFVRVSQRRGDRQAERRWLDKASAARRR